MKILVFDRDENLKGPLKNILLAVHTEEIHGDNILNIRTTDYLEKGYRLAYKDKYGIWHEFIVKGLQETHAVTEPVIDAYCEASFYELLGDYIEDKRPQGVPANTALARALEGTRWEVGFVDDLGSNTTNFYHISAMEAVYKVAEVWGGEIKPRIVVAGNKITHRYIDLLTRRGADRGKRFEFGKDISGIARYVQDDDIKTALYGYGMGEILENGEYGRRIDFAELNDGKAYVEDLEAKEIWGRPNPDGTKSHVFGKVEFDAIEDPQELLEATIEELEKRSQPQISYEATVTDLKAYGYDHEGIELGDTVAVIDRGFPRELRIKARCIRYARDLIDETNNKITLGNFLPNFIDGELDQQRRLENIMARQGIWDKAKILDPDGLSAQYLKDLVQVLNNELNAQGGYVYLTDDGKGLTTYDKPIDQDPTMAIQLLGGAFRIANSKLPNGEFDWRSFGTGAGFTADEFVAGVLRGGKVHFDLTNGTFLIGDSIEDYNFYFDGNTLKIRTSSGKTIEESLQEVQESTNSQLADFAEDVTSNILHLQEQIDGSITTWFYDYEPTTDNIPANQWVTTEEKNRHLGDLFYNTDNGYAYRWLLHNGTYSWGRVQDTDITKALEDAQHAKDVADSKRRVFTAQPTPPYDEGDLWTQGASGELMRCVNARQSGNYVASDWEKAVKYTDDTAVDKLEIGGRNLLSYNYLFNNLSDSLWSNANTRGIILELEPNKQYMLTSNCYTGSTASIFLLVPGQEPSSALNGIHTDAITRTVITGEDGVLYVGMRVAGPGVIPSKDDFINGTYWAKLEKGNKATDWTPAPEDVDEAIQNAQDTADQANNKADGLQNDLIEYIDTTATVEELGELITSMNEYMALLDTANAEVENAKLEIADLLNRVPAVEAQLGEFIQSWIFLDTYVRMGEEGLLIQEINGQTGIRITTDRIDFLDGSGEPVAYITNQIMRINRGIFVDSAQIGEHKIETIGNGHTVFTWMGEE